VSPDVGSGRRENRWTSPDVAWCRWTLAPSSAPRNIVSNANVRIISAARSPAWLDSLGLDDYQADCQAARADVSRIIGGLSLHLEVVLDAAYPQSVLAQGVQVSARAMKCTSAPARASRAPK
jgi:hypothetical protein